MYKESPMQIKESAENYLETIFVLSKKHSSRESSVFFIKYTKLPKKEG